MQFDIDINSTHKELFTQARKHLIDKYKLVETKKERITTYSDKNGSICHMRTMEYGIDFGFLKGAQMKDKFNLLVGSGKKMRVLPMKKFDKTLLDYYLHQTIELNKKVK